MNRYLIFCDARGGDRVGMFFSPPDEFSSDDWGKLLQSFYSEHGVQHKYVRDQYASAVRLWEPPVCDILYDWELAGPDGAAFLLFPLPGQRDSLVQEAVAKLRRDHDVVSLLVCRIHRLIEPSVVVA